jgi:hypothetical protein
MSCLTCLHVSPFLSLSPSNVPWSQYFQPERRRQEEQRRRSKDVTRAQPLSQTLQQCRLGLVICANTLCRLAQQWLEPLQWVSCLRCWTWCRAARRCGSRGRRFPERDYGCVMAKRPSWLGPLRTSALPRYDLTCHMGVSKIEPTQLSSTILVRKPETCFEGAFTWLPSQSPSATTCRCH